MLVEAVASPVLLWSSGFRALVFFPICLYFCLFLGAVTRIMLVLVLDHGCFVSGGYGCVASLSSTINPLSTLSWRSLFYGSWWLWLFMSVVVVELRWPSNFVCFICSCLAEVGDVADLYLFAVVEFHKPERFLFVFRCCDPVYVGFGARS